MSNDKQPAALLETLIRQFLGGILPTPEAVEAAKAYANGFLRDGDPEQSAEAIKAAAMQAAIKKTAADNGEKPPNDMQEETKRLLDMAGDDEESAEHKKTMQTLEEGLQAVTEKSAEIIKESKTRQDLATAAIDAMGDGAALLSKVYSSAAAEGGAEKDTFIRNGLEGHPDTVAEAVNVCKDVLASAARSAAMIMGGSFAMGASILPNWKADKTGGAALKMLLFMLYDEDDITGSVLQSIPKTMEYMKQHAPERAAELESCAREEVKKAFLPLLEYVNGLGREDAEPVEEEAPPNEKTLPVNVRHDPIDKHTNNAFRGVLTDKFQNFKMERDEDTKMHPVTSQVRLFIDPEKADDIKLLFGEEIKLTEREQLFYWAMCSIWEAGNPWTTYEQIARVMNCDTKKASNKGKYHKGVSNSFKQEIDTMMAKVGAMRIEAFFGEEIDRFKLKGVKRVTKGNLLYAKVDGHRIDGVYVPDAIHILDRPLLLEYSLARGQIANIPFVLLDPPSKVLKKTPEAVAIGNILIHWLYWKDVYFYELTYEEIYARRGIDPADKSASARMKRKRIRDTVDKWLTYWRNTLQVIPPYRNDLHSIRMKFPKTIGRDRKHTIFTTETIRRLKDM